jgi:transketolase
VAQIDKALDQADALTGQPTFIVAHTIKGKGVSFMEDNPEWHGKAPTPAEAGRGIREILGLPAEGGTPPAWAAPILQELAAMEKK